LRKFPQRRKNEPPDPSEPGNINTRRNVGRRIKMEKEPIEEIRGIRKKLDKLIKSNPKKFKEEIKKFEKETKNRIIVGRPKFKSKKAA
jgi:hypothetical protein